MAVASPAPSYGPAAVCAATATILAAIATAGGHPALWIVAAIIGALAALLASETWRARWIDRHDPTLRHDTRQHTRHPTR